MTDEFILNEVALQINQPLTTISHIYAMHNSFIGDMFGKPSGPRAPRPLMSDAIRYTALRRTLEDNPVALAVLQLHRPELISGSWSYCTGCDAGVEESADWPCSTIELLEGLIDA